MKKKSFLHTLSIIGAAIIIIIFIILFAPNKCRLYEDTTVKIEQGSSVTDIADTLKKRQIISNRVSFLARVIVTGKKSQLKYGEFKFKPEMSYKDVIKTLCSEGKTGKTVTITIPEGYSAEMIVDKFVKEGLGTYDEFEAALNKKYDYSFLEYADIPEKAEYALQGFLFPSTYEFYTDAAADEIIDKMLGEFEKQYKSLTADFGDIEEIITKASLIEREAKIDSEREIIAGVIENRLLKKMRLQIDASVVYVKTNGMYDTNKVYYADLKVDSPYNTYTNGGLPLGPICNPGLSSIKAALNPMGHDYLFYHTDTEKNDGSHIFTKTLEEHNE